MAAISSLITYQEEQLAYQKAHKWFEEKKYAKVILFLKPFHEEKKTDNLAILDLLASAYTQVLDKENALSIWKILYTKITRQANPDYKEAVGILRSIIACEYNNKKSREIFTQLALTTIDKHPEAFMIRDSRGRAHDAELKAMRYHVCTATALFNTADAYRTTDLILQKEFFTNAKKYYEIALENKPADLVCLLELARCIMSLENMQAGLAILLPYAKHFENNQDYNESMWKIYSCVSNKSEADIYKRKMSSTGIKSNLSDIFDNIQISPFTSDEHVPEKLQEASLKYRLGEFDEAKKLVSAFLQEQPDSVNALEFSLTLEELSDLSTTPANQMKISLLHEHLLKLKPTSFIGLISKANFISKPSSNACPQELQDAYLLYEQAYQQKANLPGLLDKLIFLCIKLGNYQKLIEYALEKTRLNPSSESYYHLATAYYQLGDFKNAIPAYKEARKLDECYQNDRISLSIIFCLFLTASSKDELKTCAKKLSSYLSRQTSSEFQPLVDTLLQLLTNRGIDIPNHSLRTKKQAQEEKSLSDVPSMDETFVPEDVKAKIKELLQSRNTFSFDSSPLDQHRYDPVAELEAKGEKLFQIGGPDSRLFGYISSHAKTASPEEADNFQKVLESGRWLSSSSKGISGIKKLEKNGKLSIKLSGTGRRMLSNGIFKRPGQNGEETIVRFSKVRSHGQLNAKR